MKIKSKLLLAGIVFALPLTGCGNGDGSDSDRIVSVASVFADATSASGIKKVDDAFHLFFKKGSDVPYISIKEGVGLLNAFKAAFYDDANLQKHYYRLTQDETKAVIVDENNAEATISLSSQTIAYKDFDNFLSFNVDGQKPLMLCGVHPDSKAFKVTYEYTKGEDVVVDLKPYTHIDIVRHGGEIYMPLSVFDSFFVSTFNSYNLSYNFQDVFIIPADGLFINLGGSSFMSPLGKAYYGGPKKEKISESYNRFQYEATALYFNYLYGLKEDKGFSNFSAFLRDKGFEGDILSGEPKKIDGGMALAFSYLEDGHTSMRNTSPLYEDELSYDKSRMDPKHRAWIEGNEVLDAERVKKAKTEPEAGFGNYLDETGKVYYITFKEFTTVDEKALYNEATRNSESAAASSTAIQFAQAYSFLTDPKNEGKAKTVVVDLTTNDGGSADSLVYSISTLVGEFSAWMNDPLSKAKTKCVYKCDLNLDGVIDAKDVGLIDKGYDVVFLNSRYTFSSGNALPCLAKANRSKIMMVGEKTAGGACAAMDNFSPIGAPYSRSTLAAICTEKEGKLVNVDGGIEAEHAIETESFFNRNYTSAMINGWLGDRK